MEPRLKWKRFSRQNILISFQTWFRVKIKHENIVKFFKIIIFHFMIEARAEIKK